MNSQSPNYVSLETTQVEDLKMDMFNKRTRSSSFSSWLPGLVFLVLDDHCLGPRLGTLNYSVSKVNSVSNS